MDIPYRVIETNRSMWNNGGPNLPPGIVSFYTGGSKMGSLTGSGIYGPGIRVTFSLGKWPTVFQAELYAIYICAKICLKRNYRHVKIGIFSDSQAALLALKSVKCASKLVWECIETLRELSRQNSVFLFWVPGHCGVEGNEHADYLARQGSAQRFIGPEPFLGTSISAIKSELLTWEGLEIVSQWQQAQGCRQAKQFIYPNPGTVRKLLSLNRSDLRIITGLLTGHCPAFYHLKKIGVVLNDTCRFCKSEPESSEHLLCSCEALASSRYNFLGGYLLTPYQVWNSNPKQVISFINYVVPNWGTGLQQNSSTPSMTSNP